MGPRGRPRYLLTESDELRAALGKATDRWPSGAERPAALLLRLVAAGARAIDERQDRARGARLSAIEQAGTGLEGLYPSDYLERLREDWPE